MLKLKQKDFHPILVYFFIFHVKIIIFISKQHQQYIKIFMNGQLDEIRVAFKMLSKNLSNVLKLEIKIKDFLL
jgi:hypothetical protein